MVEEPKICALCREASMELRQSHILPRWTYKRVLRPEGILKVDFETDGEPYVYVDSKQLKELLLCPRCEQRFATWEKHASAQALSQQDGEMGIVKGVEKRIHPEMPGAYLFENPTVDRMQLFRFALSILWRGAISSLKRCDHITMTATREEALRAYLNDEGEKPEHLIVLFVVVKPPLGQSHDYRAANVLPTGATRELVGTRRRVDVWEFSICGLHFGVEWGASLPADIREACLSVSTEFVAMEAEHLSLFEYFDRTWRQDATPRGRLANSGLAAVRKKNVGDE